MNIHAMVVDDSAIMRKMVMKSLKETELADFIFTEAGDGVEALQKLDPKSVGIMFVDWNMPNMTGIELVRAVRSTHKKYPIPIVMITTEGTMERVEEALDNAGANGYVVKPFTPEILKKKLAPLFEQIGNDKGKSKGFFGKLATKLAS